MPYFLVRRAEIHEAVVMIEADDKQAAHIAVHTNHGVVLSREFVSFCDIRQQSIASYAEQLTQEQAYQKVDDAYWVDRDNVELSKLKDSIKHPNDWQIAQAVELDLPDGSYLSPPDFDGTIRHFTNEGKFIEMRQKDNTHPEHDREWAEWYELFRKVYPHARDPEENRV